MLRVKNRVCIVVRESGHGVSAYQEYIRRSGRVYYNKTLILWLVHKLKRSKKGKLTRKIILNKTYIDKTRACPVKKYLNLK